MYCLRNDIPGTITEKPVNDPESENVGTGAKGS
jgi:hypothetical protein